MKTGLHTAHPGINSNIFRYAVIFFITVMSLGMKGFGQTNPTAQSLPYSQDFSSLAANSTNYPAGWQGWNFCASGCTVPTSYITSAPSANQVLIASSTANTATGGVHNYSGKIGILQSGSFTGAISFAINTTGVTGAIVSYDIMTIRNPYDGSANTRIDEATLQYRVGISGSFTTLTGIEYQNSTATQTTTTTTPQNAVTKNITLPAACDNQSVVQLRWVQRDVSGGGARPGFAIDNIFINTQATDFFRSKVTGNWSSTSTWESSHDGTNWFSATSIPGNTAGSTTISSGHSVTVDAASNAKSLIVNGTLNVNSGSNNLTIANAGNVTVNNNGVIIFNSTAVINGGANVSNGVAVIINTGASLTTANANGFSAGTNNTILTGSFNINRGNSGANGPIYSTSANYTYNGSTAQITGTGITGANTLTVNNTAGSTGVTLSNPTSVSTLSFSSGLLTTGSNTITVTSTISGNGAGSYVNGKLARTITTTTATNFPVGKGGNYRPVTFAYSSGPGTRTVTIEQFESTYPGTVPSTVSTANFGSRYWNIGQSATGINYTVGLNNGAVIPTGTVVMLRREGTGSTTSNSTSLSSPTYTNSSAFSTTNVSNDVALGETNIPTTTAVSALAEITYGSSTTVNLTATVSNANPGSGGTVTFKIDGNSVGTGTTDVSGVALLSYNPSALTAGSHSVTADFTAFGAYAASTSDNTSWTVNKATLTVTANNKSKVYGDDNLVFDASYNGFVNSETLATSGVTGSPSLTTTATVSSPVGSYSIAAAVGTLAASNYQFSYENGTLTVNTKPLTITANNSSKTYGSTVTFDGSEFSTVDLVNDDVVNSVTLTSSGATATAIVGSYDIEASAATGSGLSNYTINYANGTLTVNTKSLTITGNNSSKTYGSTVTFDGSEFSTMGLVNDDAVNSVTLTSSGATATAIVGSYDIEASAATGSGLSNYTINYANGTLTVNTKSLTITGNNSSKTYGSTVTFDGSEFSAVGLVNDDAVNSVTLTSSGATATAIVGSYDIEASAATGSGLSNYTINYANGTLTVNTKELIITANNQSKCFGETFVFKGSEFTTAGLVNDDIVNNASLSSAGAAANATVAGSPYIIVANNAAGTGLSNYAITYEDGSFTVKSLPGTGISNNNGLSLNCNVPNTTLTALGSGTYLWSTNETTASITVNTGGTFSVIVTGANGCSSSSSVTTTLNNTAPSAGITNNTGTTVFTCTTTSISLTATGNGTYSWSNGSTVVSTGTNLIVTAPATYTVTVKGTNGCTNTESLTITRNITPPNTGITNNSGTTVLTCASTSISLTGTGGVSYTWSNGTSVISTSSTIIATAPATYTVTAKGSNGCTATASITITRNITAPTAGITTNTGTNVLTCANPTISLTGTGGVSYTWSNGTSVISNSSTAIVSAPATYTMTAKGPNGCTGTASVTITKDISTPTIAIITNTGTTVLNCTNPTISVTGTGGVSYTWSNGTSVISTSSTYIVTNPGTYTVTAKGTNGCTGTASITITKNINVPTAGITNNSGTTVLTCANSSISLTGTGGVSYSWSNGSSVISTATTISVNTAATYTVTVKGSNGCTSTTSIIITGNTTGPAAPSIGTITQPTCSAATGSVVLNGLPSSGTWSLLRNPGSVTVSGSGTSTIVSNLSPGTYSFRVTNAAGCVSPFSANVTINPVPTNCSGIAAKTPTQLTTQTGKLYELTVKVMPNPTPNYFSVAITGKNNTPVTVRVLDIYGRLIQLNQKIGANATLQMGQKWSGGTYFVEVTQGEEKKVVKVIKAN